MFFCLLFAAEASSAASFHKILRTLVENDLVHEELQSNAELGRKFCASLGGQECYSVRSFGQGICYAGGGDIFTCGSISSIGRGICYAAGGNVFTCGSVGSVGQGICYAGGGNIFTCGSVRNVGQGICYAGGGNVFTCGSIQTTEEGYAFYLANFRDRDWDWDKFFDQYGNLVWMCRGVQTGQFANDDKCGGKHQTDLRWPRKSAPDQN